VTAAARRDQRVLVVDDDPQIRELLVRVVTSAGYACDTATGVDEARSALGEAAHDLVLLDVYLADGSGLSLARELSGTREGPAVVMVTGEDDPDLVRIALDAGAFGYVTKPFRRSDVAIAIDNALRRRQSERASRTRRDELEDAVIDRTAAVHDALERMRLAQEDTILRLSQAVDLRDPCTGSHIERMSRICGLLAARMDLDAELLQVASRLHDIGKVAVPDAILQKAGPLTPEERAAMERHAEIGYRLLRGSRSPVLEAAAEIAWTHHERFDGCGYPRGLVGDAIPLSGRVAAVADVFDALTSERTYRPAFSVDDALAHLRDGRGTQFDPAVLDAFFASLDEITAVQASCDAGAAARDAVLAEVSADTRLLTLQEAASTVGVSPSTMRRWADDGRIRAIRTAGGHRRFPLDAVRELATERGPRATVQPLQPPAEPLPPLARQLRIAGADLRARATRSLYHAGPPGWFGGDDATASLEEWVTAVAQGADTGSFGPALVATDTLMHRADLQGTTLLERHGFLERFGEATIRAMAHDQATRNDVAGARRLFVSMQQALLAAC
jgi:putative two-component system response regulator